jgi:hypothetical protein
MQRFVKVKTKKLTDRRFQILKEAGKSELQSGKIEERGLSSFGSCF